MKKIKAFFGNLFSKFMKMENKGVAILFGIQLSLCLTAVIVAIVVAASVPTGTPPEGADTDADNVAELPNSLSYCYVTFDTDGGSAIAKQRVWIGDIPIEPKEPKKDGFYFSGWTKDGLPYDFTESISQDTTLKAAWGTELQCVFEYDDGSESVTVTCKAGELISAPKREPVREGAYFVGWCVGDTLWDFESAVTESITLVPSYSTTAEITLSLGFSPFLESDTVLDAEYTASSLKPVFASLAERFDVVFKNHASVTESRVDEAISVGAELILGDFDELSERGVEERGVLINFRDYLDRMPNFKAYLEANPTVYLSLLASSGDKSVYAAPIPELFRQPSALPLFNGDVIRALLDGDEPFVSIDTTSIQSPKYMPDISASTEIRVPTVADGAVSYFVKPNSEHGNVIEIMNYLIDDVSLDASMRKIDGVRAVKILRDYIDVMYAGRFTNRSDIFLGEGAMYDTDELVALLRCVMLNRETLGLGETGGSIVVSSYDELLILTEMLFGQRGLASDSAHLYFDEDGTLYDVRANEGSYEAVKKTRNLILEGLVRITDDENAYRDSVMTLYKMDDASARCSDDAFSVALPPLAYYGDFGEVMRFLPSVEMYSERALSLPGAVEDDDVKLGALLSIIDYMYSDEGRVLINLGGGTFTDGAYASALSSGLAETLSGGDYAAFLENYLGAISGDGAYISFGDTHSDMLRTVHEYLSLGMIKGNSTLWEDDYLYSYVPDRLPMTEYNEESILEFAEITSDTGEFSFTNEDNIFVQLLCGEAPEYVSFSEHFRLEIGGSEYQSLLRRIIGRLKTYYIYL